MSEKIVLETETHEGSDFYIEISGLKKVILWKNYPVFLYKPRLLSIKDNA